MVQKLSDHNIQTIFAVTEEFQPVYKVNFAFSEHRCTLTSHSLCSYLQPLCLFQELKNLIPKSAVGTLSSNSSNVIKLIIDAYNVSQTALCLHDVCLSLALRDNEWITFHHIQLISFIMLHVVSLVSCFGQSLSSEVILENGRLPEGVSITYKSICKNGVEGTGENGRKCSNISIGDEVDIIFVVNLFAHVKFKQLKKTFKNKGKHDSKMGKALSPQHEWCKCSALAAVLLYRYFGCPFWSLKLVTDYVLATFLLLGQLIVKKSRFKLMVRVMSQKWNSGLQGILLNSFDDPINSPLSRCLSRFPLKPRSVHHMARVRPLKLNHWASLRRWR